MTWRSATVAPDGTHHLLDGAPFYAERFDDVLKFHAPGLAPVRRGDVAWHIRVDGAPAYARRFQRTFGFYEGRAAVAASDGWHHILPDGTDLYPERYAWCGNFQGGRCAVRDSTGAYLHLTESGAPAYAARWRYAGDFRDGFGVVQSDDGRSTHVDRDGRLLHDRWFFDLDVFHKGFARARDDAGWLHVDREGRPLYARRFAAVEPFYNGQARVERLDGGLEVIDEGGARVTELRPALRSELASLSGDLVGFWKTQTICAAVELGVFEVLPASAAAVARACSLDETRAHRLLRALGELHLTRHSDGVWHPTSRGEYLKASHPWTLAGAAIEYGRYFSAKWEALPDAMRAGTGWRAADVFREVAADPTRAVPHHIMLQSYALHDYSAVPRALGLRGDERVIDAGGGLGALAGLLVAEYPGLQVTVLDRPEVLSEADTAALGDRVSLHATDIFEPWGVEGDAVIMARVLHDWDDARAVRLLTHARRALRPGGRLFVVEMLVPEHGIAGALCDLHLLVVSGGQERTASQFTALMAEAGFDFDGIRRIPALPSIIVGVAR